MTKHYHTLQHASARLPLALTTFRWSSSFACISFRQSGELLKALSNDIGCPLRSESITWRGDVKCGEVRMPGQKQGWQLRFLASPLRLVTRYHAGSKHGEKH